MFPIHLFFSSIESLIEIFFRRKKKMIIVTKSFHSIIRASKTTEFTYIFSMSVQNETIFDNSTLLSNTFLTILDEVKRKFVYQLPIIFTLFGLLGFVGNLFTFLQLPFRYNACCIYTLCGSCIDAINICVNLFPNCLNPANGNLVASIGNSFLCKLKLFVLVFLPQLSMNLLIMSLIDRYICIFPLTSHWRCLLKLETVPWSIGITIIISILMSLYAPILHDVTPGFGCGSINPTLNGIVYILIHGIITPITMVIIVGLTYQRFKQNRLRVVSHSFISLLPIYTIFF